MLKFSQLEPTVSLLIWHLQTCIQEVLEGQKGAARAGTQVCTCHIDLHVLTALLHIYTSARAQE